MEESIRSLCKGVASFCNHLQRSCDALKTSVDRRAIPLDTASSTFLQSLNRRVSAASTQLNLLETMTTKPALLHLQRRLSPSSAYDPEIEIDDHETTPVDPEDGFDPRISDEEDESLLTTFQANARNEDPDISLHEFKSFKGSYDHSTDTSGASGDGLLSDFGEGEDKPKLAQVPLPLVNVSRDDYESLPSYMKSLAPWEDLLAAVEKINSGLKGKAKGSNFFHQDEISSLGLGPKARSYLLLLVRMNRLVVETVDGLISYRVL
ncbi:hypothetical protein L3X38_038469 [Prunus dulcis]|uniref:Spindle and kinetochore-associated protein 3 n=1 Tax=Prunus dulcis TaxID=3755 RepID=A0AAD4V6K2_PRUDU|nr:hypothetical protein L3X38_038469 [Prunus dulcis]